MATIVAVFLDTAVQRRAGTKVRPTTKRIGSACSIMIDVSVSGGTKENTRCFLAFDNRHTGPASGMRVSAAIGYTIRTPHIRIVGNLNSKRYISQILKPVTVPYLRGL